MSSPFNVIPDAPAEVHAAFAHVRSVYPDVVLVAFQRDGRWLYMDSDFESPAFGAEIDVSILEAASDAIESALPQLFEVVEDSR